MSAAPGSITRHADHFVSIAQNPERARPKRQVVGENPTGDTNFAGVVQQPERGLAKAETTVRLRSPAPHSGT